MSRSPSEPENYRRAFDSRSVYRRQLDRLDNMLDNGGSLSGNERNCAFLNVGPGGGGPIRFATISAVSGLDFVDDGRSHALVDWDSDGDLDLWSMNRTAPRVRFLRNDQESENHFLRLRLKGRTSNRDAIGARVEVVLDGINSRRPLVKTLRAGEGFLSQSSKWIHFGLGRESRIKHVAIHWPGEEVQLVGDLEVDSHYVITQGMPRPVAVDRVGHTSIVNPTDLELPTPTTVAHSLLTSRIPLPNMVYEDFEGKPTRLADFKGGPVLLNLWATWCVPCRAELQEFVQRANKLRGANLNILALSVDGLADGPSSDTTSLDARTALNRMAFPFRTGMATVELLRRLQLIHDLPFGQQRPISVPTSFLVDAQGRLAAIYRGPVGVDRLLLDVSKLSLSSSELAVRALPFPGTWYDARHRFAPLEIPADLLSRDFIADAGRYMQENLSDMTPQKGFPRLAGLLGDRLLRQKSPETAFRLYRAALEVDPENVSLLNNFAWHLATCEDDRFRNGIEAVKWAELAAQRTRHQVVPILDTLATAYAQAGLYDKAVTSIDRAMKIAETAGNNEQLERLSRELKQYQSHETRVNP